MNFIDDVKKKKGLLMNISPFINQLSKSAIYFIGIAFRGPVNKTVVIQYTKRAVYSQFICDIMIFINVFHKLAGIGKAFIYEIWISSNSCSGNFINIFRRKLIKRFRHFVFMLSIRFNRLNYDLCSLRNTFKRRFANFPNKRV